MSENTVNLFVEIDDREMVLTNVQYSNYLNEIVGLVAGFGKLLAFYRNIESARNYCIHFTIPGKSFNEVEHRLAAITGNFPGTTLAMTQGDTVFVEKTTEEEK